MSNKPITKPGFHDATDTMCVNHRKAKRLKGIAAIKGRVCPTCQVAA